MQQEQQQQAMVMQQRQQVAAQERQQKAQEFEFARAKTMAELGEKYGGEFDMDHDPTTGRVKLSRKKGEAIDKDKREAQIRSDELLNTIRGTWPEFEQMYPDLVQSITKSNMTPNALAASLMKQRDTQMKQDAAAQAIATQFPDIPMKEIAGKLTGGIHPETVIREYLERQARAQENKAYNILADPKAPEQEKAKARLVAKIHGKTPEEEIRIAAAKSMMNKMLDDPPETDDLKNKLAAARGLYKTLKNWDPNDDEPGTQRARSNVQELERQLREVRAAKTETLERYQAVLPFISALSGLKPEDVADAIDEPGDEKTPASEGKPPKVAMGERLKGAYHAFGALFSAGEKAQNEAAPKPETEAPAQETAEPAADDTATTKEGKKEPVDFVAAKTRAQRIAALPPEELEDVRSKLSAAASSNRDAEAVLQELMNIGIEGRDRENFEKLIGSDPRVRNELLGALGQRAAKGDKDAIKQLAELKRRGFEYKEPTAWPEGSRTELGQSQLGNASVAFGG